MMHKHIPKIHRKIPGDRWQEAMELFIASQVARTAGGMWICKEITANFSEHQYELLQSYTSFLLVFTSKRLIVMLIVVDFGGFLLVNIRVGQ